MGGNYIIVIKDVTLVMDDFLKEVNNKIDEGYTPLGGLVIHEDPISHRCYFYQTMKKAKMKRR